MAYKSTKKNKYKLRAEGVNDVFNFIRLSKGSIGNYTISGHTLIPDVVFEFDSEKSLDMLMKILRKVPDAHVMIDTFALKSKYTGNR
jgi:hypothetical protein